MGANHSSSNSHLDALREHGGNSTSNASASRKSSAHAQSGSHHRKKLKAKPHPPMQLTVAAVTHNSVTLNWLPPRSSSNGTSSSTSNLNNDLDNSHLDRYHTIIAYTIEVWCRRRPPNSNAKHHHHGNKRWQVLTKNCQSTNYEARHLESDAQYCFRVRAENVFGTGKPSAPSETITTKVFEMSSDLNCYLSPSPANTTNGNNKHSALFTYGSKDAIDGNGDGGGGNNDHHANHHNSRGGGGGGGSQVYPTPPNLNLKRRHSFNVQLDGGVSSILNHSDVYLNSSFSSSTSTIITNSNNNNNGVNTGGGGGSYANSNNNNNNSGQRLLDSNSKTLSLSRGLGHRTSWQSGRKVSSLSAFLPGAKAQSMNRLRESRNSLRSPGGHLEFTFTGNNGYSWNSSFSSTKTALLSSNNNRDSTSPIGGGKTGNNKRGESESLRNSLASASSTSDVIGSLSSRDEGSCSSSNNRRSRGSRCSLLSNPSSSDMTLSNSHDDFGGGSSSRHSDYSSSMDNLEAVVEFGGRDVDGSGSGSIGGSGSGSGVGGGGGGDDSHTGSFLQIPMFPSLEDILDQFGKTPTGESLNDHYETCVDNDDADDEISKIKQELRDIEITDEKLRSHDLLNDRLPPIPISKSADFQHQLLQDHQNPNPQIRLSQSGTNYYDTLEDPWEKSTSSSDATSNNSSDNRMSDSVIMTSPFTDDIKMALYAKNMGVGDVTSTGNESPTDDTCDDFRSLRSMLQSEQTIVRPARPIPEVMGVVVGEGGEARTLVRGKLTTIQDADEEDEVVRVTTL